VSEESIIEIDADKNGHHYGSFSATCRMVAMANECGKTVATIILGNRLVVRPGDCPHGAYARQIAKLPPHCPCCKDKHEA
jgi:hypothetical protein